MPRGCFLFLEKPVMRRGDYPRTLCRERGWTLLEILVVIVVITVLVAIALPVFSRARERALQAVCQNHLKQMGLAVRLYLQYNDNTYFPYELETREGTLYYYGLERPLGDGHVDVDVTRGYLFPYYSLVAGVGRCPSFEECSSLRRRLQGATLGYGYNRFGVAGKSGSLITAPENIVLLADSAHVGWHGAWSGPTKLIVEEFGYVTPSDFTVHFRHAGQANVLFCDGHVESRTPRKIFPVLPKSHVGMLNELGDTSLFIP
jgi:prepilin-type processing-associated H-X9-DG protein/prepilin-type N-terminal cleavage/methylation domain-containing protein